MKSDYALRVLVDLAAQARLAADTPVPVRVLAGRNGIPRRFLEHIVLDLKADGLVKSLPGRDGGFVLGSPVSTITMGRIVRLFDNSLSPIGCVSKDQRVSCPQEANCLFRPVFLDIRNVTAQLMGQITLSDLLDQRLPKLSFTGFTSVDGI